MPFTDAPWSSPESELSAEDYCAVCLIDLNEGEEKVKGKCKLPVRSTPNGPYNKNAIRNAIARINQVQAPPEERRKAARKLRRLAAEAGIQTGDTLERLAR
ncbi:MAG TPA: hypothetical protein PLJ74_12990 [Myxococcota bacterium]|nr:hypothetical protein [Myxococcota bacterium]